MVIIGFEDSDGNPVIKTEEEKKKFLEMSHMKKEDVMFADSTPSTVFIGADLMAKGIEKISKKE
jgi:hypothetical protein